MATYDDVRSTLQTGDIVLFNGHGFISRMIQFGSWSPWSHIGMVVYSEDMDVMMLWESTGLSKSRDIRDGKLKKGVQLVSLSSRIETFPGQIAVRKFEGKHGKRTLGYMKKLRKETRNIPYERSNWELIMSLLDFSWLPVNKKKTSSLFCSEMVAEALKTMKLMKDEHPSNEFTPADFGDGGMFEQYMKDGKVYGPEILIK